jgi:cytochrome c oxidase subunit 2
MQLNTDFSIQMNFKTGKRFSRILAALAIIIGSISPLRAADEAKGHELFETHCTSCHAINEKLVGPALAGVHEKRNEDWLIKWIRNSSAMIKAGDPVAVKLFNDYNKSVMTSFEQLTDGDIRDIISYIKTGGASGAPAGEAAAPAAAGAVTAPAADSSSKADWLLVVILLALTVIIIQVFKVLRLISAYTKIPFFNPQKTNAVLMIVFLVLGMFGVFWEFSVHGKWLLPEAASEHGVMIDKMFDITLIITMIVFVLTQIFLFVYAYIYRGREGRKATFYAHNNRLEVVWTVIPAIALTVLVLNGFSMWTKITDKAPENALEIDVFAYQFGWKARYAGADGKLGHSNFNLISGTNEMGIAVKSEYDAILEEAKQTLDELQKEQDFLDLNNNPTPEEKEEIDLNRQKLKLAQGHYSRLLALGKNKTSIFDGSAEDDIIPMEIHVPVDEPVLLKFRSRDVIHSAYLPYFRVQMNCVPGMPTQFWFKPTITTAEMRNILAERGREDASTFNYYLFCAKICGAAHFNMKIKVVVETRAEYDKWMASQKPRYQQQPAGEDAQADSNEVKQFVLN